MHAPINPPRGRIARPVRAAVLLAAVLAAAAFAPSAGAYHYYYANLHSHSALSDGIGTPAEAFAYARDVANIDILALTDHTHYLTSSEWQTLRTAADAATQPGGFVALAAQEFGILNDFGHLNIFDTATLDPNSPANLSLAYDFIQSTGAIGAFNHASYAYGTNFDTLAFEPGHVDAMKMLEMRNGFYSGTYEDQFNLALANGWKLGPTGNQDNHEGHWGDQANPNGGGRIYLTGVLADTLTRSDIVAAFRARRFYAMEVFPVGDRIELDFRCDGQPMGSDVVTGIAPTFTLSARAVNGTGLFGRVEIYRDGELRESRAILGTQINYQYREGLADQESHYYYAVALQVDGDHAWSAPIWVHAHVDPASVPAVDAADPRRLRAVPDPFTRGTTLQLAPIGEGESALPGRVDRVRVLDPSGRLVRDLGPARGPEPATWTWDGDDEAGREVPPGVYFLRADGPDGPAGGGRVVRVR